MLDRARAFRKSARARSSDDAETWVEDGGANTLNVFDVSDTRTTHAIVEPVAFGFSCKDSGDDTAAELSPTLRGMSHVSGNANGGGQVAVGPVSIVHPVAFNWQQGHAEYAVTPEVSTLAGRNQDAVLDVGVRRLTPVECERLQGFPDGWTEPSGSDSARYRAMGNAVTVNVVRWILGRMVNV